MEMVLLWLTRLAAAATVLPSFFMLWYLAGSDDTPRNSVAPFIGLGVMLAAVWGAIAAFRTLPHDPLRAVAIFALVPGLSLIAWPFSGTRATGRQRLLEYLADIPWLCGPLLFGALYAATQNA